MDIKEELKEIRKLNKEIKAKQEIINTLKAREEGCTSQLSDMPRGTDYPDKKDITLKRIVLEEKIECSINKLTDKKLWAYEVIDRLEKTQHRTVLLEYYLNNKTWEKVADDVGYSCKQIQRIHGEALQELRK